MRKRTSVSARQVAGSNGERFLRLEQILLRQRECRRNRQKRREQPEQDAARNEVASHLPLGAAAAIAVVLPSRAI